MKPARYSANMKRLLPYVGAVVIGLGAAWAFAPAQQPQPAAQMNSGDAQAAALLNEIAKQQAELARNMDKLSDKMNIIEEEVRQARIFSKRGG